MLYVNMNMNDLDVSTLAKLISFQVNYVTCIECCKYYSAPKTAKCGHTLCQWCWSGRKVCPECCLLVEKKALKLNLPLQNLKNHVVNLVLTFENQFKLNLDEFLIDLPNDQKTDDSNKHVTAWLASSGNHFSAPVTDSQNSVTPIHCVDYVTSNIQIHTDNKNTFSDKVLRPTHIIRSAPQDDWDKIEEVLEIEKENEEHPIGPMDIEPFEFLMNEDVVYSTNNPRRSLRKKEINNTSHGKNSAKNSDKQSSMISENKSNKLTKTWSNVTKMKKEFNKLNKKDKNKLNVSIEVCKKSQVVTINEPITHDMIMYDIEDNTPSISALDKATKTKINDNIMTVPSNYANEADISIKATNNLSVSISDKKDTSHQEHILKEVCRNEEKENELQPAKISFLKKSALRKLNTIELNKDDRTNSEPDKSPNIVFANTDDVEITIKIGNTLTNIYIKKKEKDVQIKVNQDCEIQTSNTISSQFIKNPIQNIASGKEINVNKISKSISTPTDGEIVERSISSKKNTASADTASVQYKITESIEKELASSDNMQFDEQHEKLSQDKSKVDNNCEIDGPTLSASKKLEDTQKDMEDLMDLDIFDGESVKEGNIQLLESSKKTASSILMPTMKSNKLKSQKDKRHRDNNQVENLPSSKRLKVTPCVEEIMEQEWENIDTNANMSTKTTNKTLSSQNRIVEDPQSSQAPSQNNKLNKIKNPKEVANEFSENIFSLSKGGHDSEILLTSNCKMSNENRSNKLTPEREATLRNTSKIDKDNNIPSFECNDLVLDDFTTPLQDDDSDKSVVEETPQKTQSFVKNKSKNETIVDNNIQQLTSKMTTKLFDKMETNDETNIISLSDTTDDLSKTKKNVTVMELRKGENLDTPPTISKFVNQIKHKSTPVARKSLDFNTNRKNNDNGEQTRPSTLVAAETTQEKEFLRKAFDQSLNSPLQIQRRVRKLCIAGSCLTTTEQANLRNLCSQLNWAYVDKYTKELTHLVVGVDEENRSRRSVKYMCALAAAKWIVTYSWVERCLQTKDTTDEEPFEALDTTGEPGPRRSRLAKQKLFQGITFYCMPPFSVLDEDTLKIILQSAGGRVVDNVSSVSVTANTTPPALLLAEPKNTEDASFTYLALKQSVVPVNYEWVLNCLGSYTLSSMYELLLCPVSLVQKNTANWTPELISPDYEE